MTTHKTDDHLRDYFKAVVPANFPPCPTTDAAPASVRPNAFRRDARASQWAMALAACALLALGLGITASLNNPKPAADDHGLLKDATANGKGLKANATKK